MEQTLLSISAALRGVQQNGAGEAASAAGERGLTARGKSVPWGQLALFRARNAGVSKAADLFEFRATRIVAKKGDSVPEVADRTSATGC